MGKQAKHKQARRILAKVERLLLDFTDRGMAAGWDDARRRAEMRKLDRSLSKSERFALRATLVSITTSSWHQALVESDGRLP